MHTFRFCLNGAFSEDLNSFPPGELEETQDALTSRQWRLSSRTWDHLTRFNLPWTKQLSWLRIAHSGDWCLRLALRTCSGAYQKWLNEWVHFLEPLAVRPVLNIKPLAIDATEIFTHCMSVIPIMETAVSEHLRMTDWWCFWPETACCCHGGQEYCNGCVGCVAVWLQGGLYYNSDTVTVLLTWRYHAATILLWWARNTVVWQAFYRLNTIHITLPTVSKLWKHIINNTVSLIPQAFSRFVFVICVIHVFCDSWNNVLAAVYSVTCHVLTCISFCFADF